MMFEFALSRVVSKAVVALWILCACSLLAFAVVSNFIVGVLTDERVKVSRNTLAVACGYFPNSARLLARLAQESEGERDLQVAEDNALRAIKLSPYNYNYRLLLAEIKECVGERAEAEESLRAALRLAPNKTDVHWQLANLLLREGKPREAVEEFQAACALNPRLLPVTLNLVWRASSGSLEAVATVTGKKPTARLALAQFLLEQSSPENGASVFSQLGHEARFATPKAGEFLNGLIAAKRLKLARDLWIGLIGDGGQDPALIWNGSFEYDIVKDLAQFDWITYNSDYAKIRISNDAARTGLRSLRIDFAGRDTTRLDEEIKQLIVVRPGGRYRLDCYAKAEKLVTSEGPRVVVTGNTSPDFIAASDPLVSDLAGWHRLAVEFVAPPNANDDAIALRITIKRRPRFSYDEPTRGTVYFDDFTLTELATAGTVQLAASIER